MNTVHNLTFERDGSNTSDSDLTEEAHRIIEQIARCTYMVSRHREGIALNFRRMAELRSELQRLGGGR